MDRGIYTAASGGLLQSRKLQTVANNLANASTVGFKAERMVNRQQEFADTLAGALDGSPARAQSDHERTPGVVDIQSTTDFTPGPVETTGNPLHIALADRNTFFVVQGPQGEQYTRAGNFTTDVEGNLVTADGLPVMGEGGPIVLTPGTSGITSNGTVTVNGQAVGRVRTVSIEDTTKLRRQEGVRFNLEGGEAAVVPANVIPRSVELPNLGVVESMVDMIAAQRSFESYQKTVQTIDELNNLAIRNARVAG